MKTTQYSLQGNTRKVLEKTVIDLSIRIEQVPRLAGTRAVPSKILALRLNGTETRWRHSCQCEHIRLNAHDKIFLMRNIPQRNGNVTHGVNRPYPVLGGLLKSGKKMQQSDTGVAVVAAVFLTTRFSHISTDVIVRDSSEVTSRCRSYISHEPETNVKYGFKSIVL